MNTRVFLIVSGTRLLYEEGTRYNLLISSLLDIVNVGIVIHMQIIERQMQIFKSKIVSYTYHFRYVPIFLCGYTLVTSLRI